MQSFTYEKHRYHLRLRPTQLAKQLADEGYVDRLLRGPAIDSYRTAFFARRACEELNRNRRPGVSYVGVWDSAERRWVTRR